MPRGDDPRVHRHVPTCPRALRDLARITAFQATPGGWAAPGAGHPRSCAACSGANLLPVVQRRHVGGGQARGPALFVGRTAPAVMDEAVTEHLIDRVIESLVALFEHGHQVLMIRTAAAVNTAPDAAVHLVSRSLIKNLRPPA